MNPVRGSYPGDPIPTFKKSVFQAKEISGIHQAIWWSERLGTIYLFAADCQMLGVSENEVGITRQNPPFSSKAASC